MLSEDEYAYILASRRRQDIIYVLGEISATSEEIAAATGAGPSYIGIVASDLTKKGYISHNNKKPGKLYSLEDKGKEAYQKLKDYYGIDR